MSIIKRLAVRATYRIVEDEVGRVCRVRMLEVDSLGELARFRIIETRGGPNGPVANDDLEVRAEVPRDVKGSVKFPIPIQIRSLAMSDHVSRGFIFRDGDLNEASPPWDRGWQPPGAGCGTYLRFIYDILRSGAIVTDPSRHIKKVSETFRQVFEKALMSAVHRFWQERQRWPVGLDEVKSVVDQEESNYLDRAIATFGAAIEIEKSEPLGDCFVTFYYESGSVRRQAQKD